jgi:hypothetical protein
MSLRGAKATKQSSNAARTLATKAQKLLDRCGALRFAMTVTV